VSVLLSHLEHRGLAALDRANPYPHPRVARRSALRASAWRIAGAAVRPAFHLPTRSQRRDHDPVALHPLRPDLHHSS
jgi:hypothetical protein